MKHSYVIHIAVWTHLAWAVMILLDPITATSSYIFPLLSVLNNPLLVALLFIIISIFAWFGVVFHNKISLPLALFLVTWQQAALTASVTEAGISIVTGITPSLIEAPPYLIAAAFTPLIILSIAHTLVLWQNFGSDLWQMIRVLYKR